MRKKHQRGGQTRKHYERSGGGKKRFKDRIEHKPETKKKAGVFAPSSLPAPENVVGILTRTSKGWTIESSDLKDKNNYIVRKPAAAAAEGAGSMVVAKLIKSTKKGKQEVEIIEVLGEQDDPKILSKIAIESHGIPSAFSPEALDEAARAKPVEMKGRVDLRHLPLVTIDGPDARDFDDAVFAEKDGNGWHLVVAIADVAHYVRGGSALDKDAYARGNSTYFPDRVVPMLPEALSNDLCSLMPHKDRACMAAHLWIDEEGELTKWKFVRGVMKSRARLTYEQVQAARDGKPDATTKPLEKDVIAPLYGAFACLMAARLKRGTLDLDLPERKVDLNDDGTVRAIKVRERLDSHKLIEEFMILANVAAAAQLEGKGGLCLYRVHDKPSEVKLDSLRDFLNSLGINLAASSEMHPRVLTHILELAAKTPHAPVVNEVMLRSQAQAVYSHENIGHFGLALAKYAHFTSPIRRYADLMVHRGLIRVCGLGDDGLNEKEIERLSVIGKHISDTERRSIAAERDTIDRYVALYLSECVGHTFEAKICGVTHFGLFARLKDAGADGLIPFKALPRDFYTLDEKNHVVTGQESKRAYRLGDDIKVRLTQADRLTGGMSFAPVQEEKKPTRNAHNGKTRGMGRPGLC